MDCPYPRIEEVRVEAVGNFKFADLETAGDGAMPTRMRCIARIVDENER